MGHSVPLFCYEPEITQEGLRHPNINGGNNIISVYIHTYMQVYTLHTHVCMYIHAHIHMYVYTVYLWDMYGFL